MEQQNYLNINFSSSNLSGNKNVHFQKELNFSKFRETKEPWNLESLQDNRVKVGQWCVGDGCLETTLAGHQEQGNQVGLDASML